MSVRLLLTTTVVAAGVLAPAATSGAAKKAPSYPTVKSISPMRVEIGGTMTITGKNFRKGKGKNTVVFRRSGKKVVFVKADGLSSKKLRFTVPAKLRTALGRKSGELVATKFQIRVLAKRFGKTYTALKRSPVVAPGDTPAEGGAKAPVVAAAAAPAPAAAAAAASPPPAPDCDGDGTPDATDTDDDNDLLPDATESSIGTVSCAKDSDGDGMEDGWEYRSAIDLNRESCPAADFPSPCPAVRPYPNGRPYPNPLFPDASTDYDGDWLNASQEHAAWQRKARADASYYALEGAKGMWYSAGLQASQDDPAVPVSGCRGLAVPTTTAGGKLVADPNYAVYSLDRFGRHAGDGCLNDAERDEDGDLLANWIESTGPLSGTGWWKGNYEDEKLYWWATYDGTDWLDADSDNDGVDDGVDDQDYDDFWNMEEVARGSAAFASAALTGNLTGLWVHAFNPCLPATRSRTCPPVIPLSGEIWAPFAKDSASEPATRWPLYRDEQYAGELWDNPGTDAQDLPPAPAGTGGGVVEHPLPR
jgi:hypothetical protein